MNLMVAYAEQVSTGSLKAKFLEGPYVQCKDVITAYLVRYAQGDAGGVPIPFNAPLK